VCVHTAQRCSYLRIPLKTFPKRQKKISQCVHLLGIKDFEVVAQRGYITVAPGATCFNPGPRGEFTLAPWTLFFLTDAPGIVPSLRGN